MRVEIASDVVCPWCFIGKRRFEAAVAQLATEGVTLDLEVGYRAFMLDPSAPTTESRPVRESYARRFGGDEKADKILANVTEIGTREGLEFNFGVAIRANTLRAHRLLKIVQRETPHLQSQVNESVMNAYFRDAKNINEIATLLSCAAQAGFGTRSLADELADDSADSPSARAVAGDLEWASRHDITAVPTFVVNDDFSIPGAQDTSTFIRLLRRFT